MKREGGERLLPLAAAAARLRRPPGRPRKGVEPDGTLVSQASAPAATPPSMRVPGPAVADLWPNRGPRLLGLKDAAAYLGVSTWTIRAWLAEGLVARVKLPGTGGGELERLLIDRADLDALIADGKDGP